MERPWQVSHVESWLDSSWNWLPLQWQGHKVSLRGSEVVHKRWLTQGAIEGILTKEPADQIYTMVSLFFVFFLSFFLVTPCSRGSYFLNQGSNPCPLLWECWYLNHWITREVLQWSACKCLTNV